MIVMTTGMRMSSKSWDPMEESRSFPEPYMSMAVLLTLNVVSPGDLEELTV